MAGTGRSSSCSSYGSRSTRYRRSFNHSYNHNHYNTYNYVALFVIYIFACMFITNLDADKDYQIWYNNTQIEPGYLYTKTNNFNTINCYLEYNDTCNIFGHSDVQGSYSCKFTHKLHINSRKNHSIDADGYHKHKHIELYINKYSIHHYVLTVVMSRCPKLKCYSYINLTITKDMSYGNYAGYLGSNGTMNGHCELL